MIRMISLAMFISVIPISQEACFLPQGSEKKPFYQFITGKQEVKP